MYIRQAFLVLMMRDVWMIAITTSEIQNVLGHFGQYIYGCYTEWYTIQNICNTRMHVS